MMHFEKEQELLNLLKDKVKKRSVRQNQAVFDADGTLWYEDANNILLDYQKQEGLRELEEVLDPRFKEEGSRYKRCELFIQKQAGLNIEEFREHCREALKKTPLHIFPFQKDLISYLKQEGLSLFIVTASIKWLVEEAVKLYELPIDKVLGTESKLKDNVISAEIIRPAPMAKAKAEVFLKHGSQEALCLAGGNTMTDFSILEIATHPFVVHSADKDHENFSGEEVLTKRALQKNWIVFQKKSS